jgi:hypothetical protein
LGLVGGSVLIGFLADDVEVTIEMHLDLASVGAFDLYFEGVFCRRLGVGTCDPLLGVGVHDPGSAEGQDDRRHASDELLLVHRLSSSSSCADKVEYPAGY